MKSPIKKSEPKNHGELTEKEMHYVQQADFKNKVIEVPQKRNRIARPVSYSLTEDDMDIFSTMYEVIVRNKKPHDKFPKNSDIIKMGLRKLAKLNDEKQIINLYYEVINK